jgi:hypothetical protein
MLQNSHHDHSARALNLGPLRLPAGVSLSPWSPAAAPQLLLQYLDPASLLASSSRDQQTLRMITELLQQQLLSSQFFCYNYFKSTAKCRRGIKAVRRCAAGNQSTTSCSYTISWTLESRTTIYPPKLQDNTGVYPACCKFPETLEISASTTLTIAAAILANPWHQNYKLVLVSSHQLSNHESSAKQLLL